MARIERSKPLLGTCVDVSIEGPQSFEELIELSTLAFNEIQRVQDLMSFHDAQSELSQINTQAATTTVALSPDMAKVLTHALLVSHLTAGDYDVTIAPELIKLGHLPASCDVYNQLGTWKDLILIDNKLQFQQDTKVDLGGIAKGYAVDVAFEAVVSRQPALSQLVINAGGDLRMLNWQQQRVKLRSPKPGQFVEVMMRQAALASSHPHLHGRESTIVHKSKSLALPADSSVSVFASHCMVADSLTKVAFVCPFANDVFAHFKADLLWLGRSPTQDNLHS